MWYPFKKIITDIRNYRFLLKTIKKNKDSVEFQKFNLRHDWVGRLYTVINIPPEVLYSPDSPQEIRPAYVLEESRPLNEYLTTLNLTEIVIPVIEPIEGSTSWLLVYKPYFQKISWRWFLTRSLLLLVLWWAQWRFGVISYIWDLIVKAFEYLF
jgi:hypothetical protein